MPVLFGALMVFGSCYYTQQIDLRANPYIYQSPQYRAPRSTDAPVFVQRMKYDEQKPDLSQRDSVKTMESDAIWERKLPVMVEEILLDEIDYSGIYKGISSGSGGLPRGKDYVIVPTLLALQRYREVITNGEKIGKRRHAAYASMRLQVMSPGRRDW